MESLMKSFTVRNIPAQVEQFLRQSSSNSHQSLNKTILSVFSKAAGLTPDAPTVKKRDVRSILQPWNKDECDAFNRNSSIYSTIDDEIWKP